MRQEKLTFAVVTKPNLGRLKVIVPKVLPFVDRAVVVIGERNGEVEKYLLTLGPKVEVYFYKWHDNFAASWNAYLSKMDNGWVMILDDDEVPSDSMLESLDKYIEESSQGNNYCCVEFRCNPISEGSDLGACNYWRQILYRFHPGMKYSGGTDTGCHQFIVGYQNNKMIRSDEVYYHIKSLKDEYRNAARNMYIYGIWLHGARDGIQREEWHELKGIILEVYPEVDSFMDLDKYLVKGDVHADLKVWMIKWYNDLKQNSEYFKIHLDYKYEDYNEIRALSLYYYKFLHSEEATIDGFVE